MQVPEIYEQRATFSSDRLAVLERNVAEKTIGIKLEGLTIFTAGSYARHEASPASDIDLFFTYDEEASQENKTSEIQLFGRLIDLVSDMRFPAFSNDGQFLHTHHLSDILKSIGGQDDDHKNFFTMRMLMLLESKPVYGSEVYDSIMQKIVGAYFKDYDKHSANFRPWFLINDVMRFWKTLLLNYEFKRLGETDPVKRQAQRLKNFKLKYSRLTTCFATVAAIGSLGNDVDEAVILEIVSQTPINRLSSVASNIPVLTGAVESLLVEYGWFLEQTALEKEQLNALFLDRKAKAAMFERAEKYGAQMFDLVTQIDGGVSGKSRGLLRTLVI